MNPECMIWLWADTANMTHDEIIACKKIMKVGLYLTVLAGITVFIALLTLIIEK